MLVGPTAAKVVSKAYPSYGNFQKFFECFRKSKNNTKTQKYFYTTEKLSTVIKETYSLNIHSITLAFRLSLAHHTALIMCITTVISQCLCTVTTREVMRESNSNVFSLRHILYKLLFAKNRTRLIQGVIVPCFSESVSDGMSMATTGVLIFVS